MSSASAFIAKMRGEVGYSRYNDPQAGTKYGRWYAGLKKDPSFGVSGVPYCAMFISWALYQVGGKCVGFPAAYCPYIVRDARAAGVFLPPEKMQPGDVLMFDWEGDGVSDHTGGVCASVNLSARTCQTIEGNTNNGQVAYRTRSFSTIMGAIRPSFGSGSTSTDTGSSSGSGSSTGGNTVVTCKTTVDGEWGYGTTILAQKILGTVVDGIISNQFAAYRSVHPALVTSTANLGSWVWVTSPGTRYSPLIQAMQKKIGVTADGHIGPATARALQKYLGVTVDGIMGTKTVKALQTRLNTGKF